MRWVRIIAVCVAASLATGCFVMNELDSSKKEMGRYSHSEESHSAPAAPAPTATPNAKAGTSSMAAWWKKAHTLSSDKMDESITSCRIHGHVEFMRKSDCAARGGAAG